MAVDLEKLSPTPWRTGNWDAVTWAWLESRHGKADRDFIALAREAFDVMLRRGWRAVPYFPEKGWDRWCVEGGGVPASAPRVFPDPFTAVVECERLLLEENPDA